MKVLIESDGSTVYIFSLSTVLRVTTDNSGFAAPDARLGIHDVSQNTKPSDRVERAGSRSERASSRSERASSKSSFESQSFK